MHEQSITLLNGNESQVKKRSLDLVKNIYSANWQKVKLMEICSLRSEIIDPEKAANSKYIGLEHIDTGKPYLSRWGSASDVKSSKFRFYPSDILYGKLRPYLEKSVKVDFEGICSTDILVFCPNSSIDTDFLSYLVHTKDFTNHAIQSTAGVNHPRTSWSSLANFDISLPPLLEQRAIAHILQTVQQAIQTRHKELKLECERKAALVHHLFIFGIRKELTKQSEIGNIPESWTLIRLGKIIVSGPKNGIYKHQSYYGTGTNIIRINDFNNDGEIISAGSSRVRLLPNEIREYQLKSEDILINRVNSVSHLGKTALIGPLSEDCVFESNMMCFTVDKGLVIPEYVFRFLSSPLTRVQIRDKARRAVAQSSINQGDIKSILIPLCSLAEQKDIINVLRACDAKIRVLRKEIILHEELFRSLLNELMTGRISTLPLVEQLEKGTLTHGQRTPDGTGTTH